MSPYRIAGLEALFRWCGFGLAIEMAGRSIAVWLAAPGRATVFQVIAAWSLPFTMIGVVLLLIGHFLIHRESTLRYVLSLIGHLIGLVWAFAFGAAILIGWVAKLIFNQGEGTGITGFAFLFLAALHGGLAYICARRAKWTRLSSPASSPQ